MPYVRLCRSLGRAGQAQAQTPRGWTIQGRAVAFVTLTQSHCLEDRLAILWGRLEDGWASVVRGSGWQAAKNAYGLRGFIRVTEVVHHPITGWNVHLHVFLLLDQELDHSQMNELKDSLTARFARGVRRSGGYRRGQWSRFAGDDTGHRGTTCHVLSQRHHRALVKRWFPKPNGDPVGSRIHRTSPYTLGGIHRCCHRHKTHAGDHLQGHRLPVHRAPALLLISREIIQLTPAQISREIIQLTPAQHDNVFRGPCPPGSAAKCSRKAAGTHHVSGSAARR